ncbi:MAG: VWA domain-containing protein [Candidatus Hydrogenedentota bacterium]
MNPFAPFHFTELSHPWVLILWLVVAVLFAFEILAGAPGALGFSTGAACSRFAMRPRKALLRRAPAALRAIGLGLLVVALARPLDGQRLRKDRANIIDIMLCVDVSGSMQQPDLVYGGQERSRLYVTKAVVRDFIDSRRQRSDARYGMDRLGLLLYAGFAWTQCPLTLDYAVLEHELRRAHVDESDKRKHGTAIGSALGLAVQRLQQSEAKSKVIILLTDGLNNRGELDPITAAQVAKEFDMRVYTIGVGSTERQVISGPGFMSMQSHPIDEASLRQIAEITGGRYYRATSTELLREAYNEISELETTEIELGDYYEYEEAFVSYAVLGALALLAAVLSRRHWFETIP